MNGVEVYGAIPVVILTTSGSPEYQEQTHRLNAEGFITKPITATNLRAIAHWIRLTLVGRVGPSTD